jgi:hypothetical protein
MHGGQSGQAFSVKIVVDGPTGTVVSASSDGSKAGKCVAGRVRQVSLPKSGAGRQTYTRTVKIP